MVDAPECKGQIWDNCIYREWAEKEFQQLQDRVMQLDMQCRGLIHELTMRRNHTLEEAALACDALDMKNKDYGCQDCAHAIRSLKRPPDAPHS